MFAIIRKLAVVGAVGVAGVTLAGCGGSQATAGRVATIPSRRRPRSRSRLAPFWANAKTLQKSGWHLDGTLGCFWTKA